MRYLVVLLLTAPVACSSWRDDGDCEGAADCSPPGLKQDCEESATCMADAKHDCEEAAACSTEMQEVALDVSSCTQATVQAYDAAEKAKRSAIDAARKVCRRFESCEHVACVDLAWGRKGAKPCTLDAQCDGWVPLCRFESGRCVECLQDSDCPGTGYDGYVPCVAHSCSGCAGENCAFCAGDACGGCRDDSDCPEDTDICSGGRCVGDDA